MERLTSNKSVSEMGMYELAHNSCYVKDGKARVRDFEDDSDARELAIKLLEKYADIPNDFTCDEDFDDFMADSLQYGTDDSILGLIAVFYRNLWAMAGLRETLKEYEDLEEQGKLLKLPCAVGDTVYRIEECGEITELEVLYITFFGDEIQLTCKELKKYGEVHHYRPGFSIGRKVFYTREEDKAALKELKDKKYERV